MAKPSKSAVLAAAERGTIRLDGVDTGVCPQMAADVRDYIGDMAAGLAELAYANKLDALAVACDVVREIAKENVTAEARLVRPS